MTLKEVRIGFALTGSFCTFNQTLPVIANIVETGAQVTAIMSEHVYSMDTRFGLAQDLIDLIEEITGNKIINNINAAEPIGPKSLLDILIVAPCTGNTIAKLAYGITDTAVTMAAKAHLRNNKPIVVAISTNDGLGANAKNIGILINSKNIYFVPFRQDDPKGKNNSLVARTDLIIPTIENALEGRQIQPVMLGADK